MPRGCRISTKRSVAPACRDARLARVKASFNTSVDFPVNRFFVSSLLKGFLMRSDCIVVTSAPPPRYNDAWPGEPQRERTANRSTNILLARTQPALRSPTLRLRPHRSHRARLNARVEPEPSRSSESRTDISENKHRVGRIKGGHVDCASVPMGQRAHERHGGAASEPCPVHISGVRR